MSTCGNKKMRIRTNSFYICVFSFVLSHWDAGRNFLLPRLCRNLQPMLSYREFLFFNKCNETLIIPLLIRRNISGQKELKRKKGYGFIFLGISLQEEKLIITFSSKIVFIPKKHHLNIAVSGWGNYTYKYSSEKQKWNLVETKYGGI